MPVHLTHRAGLDVKMASRNRLGDWEVFAVNNTRLAATAFICGSVKHVVGVLVFGLLERWRLLLVNALRYGAWEVCVSRPISQALPDCLPRPTLENVLVLLVDVLKNLRRQAEVLCHDRFRCVLDPFVQ